MGYLDALVNMNWLILDNSVVSRILSAKTKKRTIESSDLSSDFVEMVLCYCEFMNTSFSSGDSLYTDYHILSYIFK